MSKIRIITDPWGRQFLQVGKLKFKLNDVEVDESLTLPWNKYVKKTAKKYFKRYKLKFSSNNRVFLLFIPKTEMSNVKMFEKDISKVPKPLYYEIVYF